MLNSFIHIKKERKKYFESLKFNEIWGSIAPFENSLLIEDKNIIKCLDSILESLRDKIFYIQSYKYSVIYDLFVIEKYFLEDTIYVLTPLKIYKKQLINS